MTILITGSNGFIGSNLLTFLKEKGHDVLPFEGDVTEIKAFERYRARQIETVIHLAGKTTGRPKSEFEKINCLGTENVADFCQKEAVRRLIFFSTIKVLSRLNNPYVDSKKRAEEIIISSGVPYIIIRPSLIYGPGESKNIGQLINLAKKLPLLPICNFKFQPIYLEDLLKVVLSCLNIEPNRIFNLAGLETIEVAGILKSLKKRGFKTRPVILPRMFNWPMMLLSQLPVSPLPAWQVKSLLEGEEFAGRDWPVTFNLEPTSFKEGLLKILNEA